MPLPATPSAFAPDLGAIVVPGVTIAFDGREERLVLVCDSFNGGPPDLEIVPGAPDGTADLMLDGRLLARVTSAAPLGEDDFLLVDRATARRMGLAGTRG